MMGLKMITATSMLGGKISLLDHRKKKNKKICKSAKPLLSVLWPTDSYKQSASTE